MTAAILWFGSAAACGLLGFMLARVWDAVSAPVPVPVPAPRPPAHDAPRCSCPTCSVVRNAPKLGAGIAAVASGTVSLCVVPVPVIDDEGVGQVRVLFVDEALYATVILPALDAHTRGQR